MREIRLIREAEKQILRRWWQRVEEVPPFDDMMPIDSTFLVVEHGLPSLSMTCYLTNGPMGWLDNFIRNPDVPAAKDFSDTRDLLEVIDHFAKEAGKRILFCMSAKASTLRLYEHLGFTKTLEVSTLTKGLI